MSMSVSRTFPVKLSSGDVHEWFLRFEICKKTNKWSKETMSLKLPQLLEGEALNCSVGGIVRRCSRILGRYGNSTSLLD